MKKFFTSLMVLATLATAFSSCTKEADVQKSDKVSGKMKTITVQTDIETRTTLDSNHENIVWSSNDNISIFNDVNADNIKLTYVSDGSLTVSVPDATKEIFAHYPYYSGNEEGPENVSIYISKSQTQKNPGELNGYNYPMVAKGTVSDDNKAIVSLYPVASALALNIYNTNLSGTETVKSVTVTPASSSSGFIGSQKTNLKGDNIKYTTADGSDPITVTLTNALPLKSTRPADKQKFDGQIYVCLAKQKYAEVKFDIQTNKGTYTITSSETPFDCESNDFVPVNINLSKAQFQPAEELSGTYVILAKETLDNVVSFYAMANTHENNSNRLDEVSFADGTTTTADRSIVWNIAKSGDNYAITDMAGNYLTASSSNNANVNTEAVYCSIIENTDGSYSVMQTVGTVTRYLSRNNSDKGFAFYGNTTQNYKLLLTKIQLQAPPTLAWGAESITLDADDEDTHEVALTAVGATSVSIAVFDEDEETAIDWLVAEYANGKVTYVAEANNSSVRKAVIVATATNSYGSVTAKIKVTQKADNSHITKGPAWTYTFTNTDFAQANTAYSGTYNNLTLSFKSSKAKSQFDASSGRGVQFGAAIGEFTITTSGYEDGIESIKLVVSSNAAGNTISAAIDGESIGNQITLSNANNVEIEFKSEDLMAGGNIVFSINDATKTVWLKSITINPEAPAPATVTGISVEDYTPSFAVSATDSYTFDGKVYAVYSDESKVELSSDAYSISGSVNLATAGTYNLTISASIDGSSYSKQISISVVSNTSSWTRVTDVNTLLAGGTFIIGYEATANSGIIIPMANTGSATTSAAGYLYSGASASNGGNTTIDMSSVTSTSSYEVTIEASTVVSGAINIKLGNYYLGNTNTKNNCKLFTSATKTTAFTPTIGTNNVFTLKIDANETYQYLKYNTSSPRFAVYSTAPENIVIYKKN